MLMVEDEKKLRGNVGHFSGRRCPCPWQFLNTTTYFPILSAFSFHRSDFSPFLNIISAVDTPRRRSVFCRMAVVDL